MWRSLRIPAYRHRWAERLGHYNASMQPARSCVVFHAVSVGEVHAAQPLIEAFMQARPEISIVLTTTTPTGSERVQALFGDRVKHVYLPWDLPGPVSRFLTFFNPKMLVLMETELWPNLLAGCIRHGCPCFLINARLSEKSLRGYLKIRTMAGSMLKAVNAIAAQSQADAKRFVALGYPESAVLVTGSLKFDVRMDQEKILHGKALKSAIGSRPVWIAASTREGEDQKVLQAHALARRQVPDLLLVLVPRHPERFTLAAQLSEEAGFATQRYSQGRELAATTSVLVGDTMGDLVLYYALADIAFVGGSLVNTGCQNVIEAAAMGLPVLAGPSRFNFQAVSDEMLKAGALVEVENEEALARVVQHMVTDESFRKAVGAAALAHAASNQGATLKVRSLLLDKIPTH